MAALAFAAAWGQANEDVDAILAADSITFGQAAYILLVGSENISDDADQNRCMGMLVELGWVASDTAVDTKITLGEYAFLVMKAFGIRGGLMYSLFPGSRYAIRELRYLGIVQGRADGMDFLSGETAIRILYRAIEYKTGVQ
jgi:hypothetical protein